MDKLPENVLQITTFLRSKRPKKCQCYEYSYEGRKKPNFSIDFENREVFCEHCGNPVDSFEVLEILMEIQEERNADIKALKKQAQELANYKPWLKSIKRLESEIRSGKYSPVCPNCHKAFNVEDIEMFVPKPERFKKDTGENIKG